MVNSSINNIKMLNLRNISSTNIKKIVVNDASKQKLNDISGNTTAVSNKINTNITSTNIKKFVDNNQNVTVHRGLQNRHQLHLNDNIGLRGLEQGENKGDFNEGSSNMIRKLQHYKHPSQSQQEIDQQKFQHNHNQNSNGGLQGLERGHR
jgi:hypothetical protein